MQKHSVRDGGSVQNTQQRRGIRHFAPVLLLGLKHGSKTEVVTTRLV